MSDGPNGLDRINRNEFEQNMQEVGHDIAQLIQFFEEMKEAINTQAEVLGLLRFTVHKYLPEAHVAEAAREYKALREREILTATTPAANA